MVTEDLNIRVWCGWWVDCDPGIGEGSRSKERIYMALLGRVSGDLGRGWL